MKRHILSAALLSVLALPAFAGDQYVDASGFAVSGYDVVAYRSLDQNAVGQAQPEAVPGRADITADYNGATFAFSSEANRDKFLEKPEYYVPQFDGHCAYGVSKGGKVPGNPDLWRIIDDKLYLNLNKTVVGFFEEDIPGNLTLADNNWPSLDPQDASDRAVPDFEITAPLQN